MLGQTAHALPGTHAPAISTFDTRASSVVLAYRHGSSDAGPFNTFSYNANFTNTTGKLSAQFGIHYVNFASKLNDKTAHGAGASGVALFVFPVAGRWDDGVPKAALSFYVGSVPTAYVSGERNYITLPLVLGFGVPLSPHRAVTFTPWFEIAPSANLDTVFKAANITGGVDSIHLNPDGTYSLNEGAIQDAVKKGVTVDLNASVPLRAGLEAGIHLGQTVDFNLYTSITTLGGGFSGSSVFSLGGGLVFRWDDIVPAVLPVERRLDREGCDAIEARFRSCPNSRQWLSPEQRAREPKSSAPAVTSPAANQPGAPPPNVPAGPRRARSRAAGPRSDTGTSAEPRPSKRDSEHESAQRRISQLSDAGHGIQSPVNVPTPDPPSPSSYREIFVGRLAAARVRECGVAVGFRGSLFGHGHGPVCRYRTIS